MNKFEAKAASRSALMKVISIIKKADAPLASRFSDGSGHRQGFTVRINVFGNVVIENGTSYDHYKNKMVATLPAIEKAIKAAGLNVEIDLPYASKNN